MDIKVKFGSRVHKPRENIGLSQDKLAFKSGTHRTWIGIGSKDDKEI
jgi:transcriptional regulator with XRE-family HTH domain